MLEKGCYIIDIRQPEPLTLLFDRLMEFWMRESTLFNTFQRCDISTALHVGSSHHDLSVFLALRFWTYSLTEATKRVFSVLFE